MIRQKPFLRWFLLATLMSVGAYFAHRFEFFEKLKENDFTHLGFTIIGIFGLTSLIAGWRTRKVASWVFRKGDYYTAKGELINKAHVAETTGIVWFASAICTSLGMIGTVWGFIEAFKGFVNLDSNDTAAVQATMTHLTTGVNAALYTTFVGLVCALLLKLQAYHLDYSIREKK